MESNCIVFIRDKQTNITINSQRYTIEKISSKYSNTKTPIYKLVIDGIAISRNNSYVVRYRCITCNIESEITLNLFIRKFNRNIIRCDACKNKDQLKCSQHRDFMKQNASLIVSGNYTDAKQPIKEKGVDEHITMSQTEWDTEDDEFKQSYFSRNLTQDEFDRIRSKIISINNGKFMDIESWDYCPYYRVYNQTRYAPMLVHRVDKLIEKPLYLKYKCDNCDSEFTHRDLKVVKNKYKILCQTCSLTNRAFQLRKKTLKNGDTILWQSVPERRFIEWCETHDIPITNGPKLPYIFRDSVHIYRVDFELPIQRMLVEIKDNHCWHQAEVTSGKYAAKETSAKEWATTNNYTYHVIFPKTIQSFKDSILQQSL